MLDVLLLRFDAPMMSFGTVAVDAIGHTSPFPGRSLLTGLLGNALGYDHREAEALTQLQARLQHAVRRDLGGEERTDYQTVDLGQDFLRNDVAWTTWGRLDPRGGSAANKVGTHIRHRDYIVDSVFTIAMTLSPADEEPVLGDLEQALREPARPLFLGRKCCIPAAPILLGRTRAKSLAQAIREAPAPARADRVSEARARLWWPADDEPELSASGRRVVITDARDWRNQVHVGTYAMIEGVADREQISPEEADDGR